MNTTTTLHTDWTPEPEALQTRFALRVAARLDQLADHPPHDIGERLRVARELALERARAARKLQATASPATASMPMRPRFGIGSGWWLKVASVVPLLALVMGLVLIDESTVEEQVRAAADVDAALLSDNLPPDAYSDPGFAAFLEVSNR